MITKLAKKIACFFVANKLAEAEDEEIYAYGTELLLSTIFNLFIAVIIAAATNTFIPCLIELTAFVTIRIYAGGYHADTHRGCMLTLVAVQGVFIGIVEFMPTNVYGYIIPIILIFSLLVIFIFSPVAHPNKPLSASLKAKLSKKAYISASVWTVFTVLSVILGKTELGFYSAFGMLTISLAMIAEKVKLRSTNNEENQQPI